MQFYVLLAIVNVACFLPLYALNARAAPNPLGFLKIADRPNPLWIPRLLYTRSSSTDPFRIHFDFSFWVLVAAAMGWTGSVAQTIGTVLLAAGFVEILYTTVMHSVFKRAPALASDLSLLGSGVSLAQRQAYWMVPAALGALTLVAWVAWLVSSYLFALAPQDPELALAGALLLLPPCLYHATRHYDRYLWRTVYSPVLHLALNIRFDALVRRLYRRNSAYYAQFNDYRDLRLVDAPNIVIVCVESYGSIAYCDQTAATGVGDLVRRHETLLTGAGYRFASTWSTAPLFAGGSWLSYASFLYGVLIDNIQLYNGLFAHRSEFSAYESVLHVLRRNGYENVLLCPLGGVDLHTVDWDSVDRCFQTQRRFRFDDLDYVGPRLNYLGAVRRFSPLDQFSLNHAYETAAAGGRPFSLFFCTLNSHYPWHSATEAVGDWRTLNAPAAVPPVDPTLSAVERYNAAIRYQLDYIMRFVEDRAADAPLVIVFGDHQPPLITPDHLGRQTPVHVLSRDAALVDSFLDHGFADALDLSRAEPRAIRHEAFMSLLMRGLARTYGTDPTLDLPYRERGSAVFGDAEGRQGAPS